MDLLQAYNAGIEMPAKSDVISAIEDIKKRYKSGYTTQAVRDLVVLKQMEFFVKETLKIVAPYATAAVAGMSEEQRKNTCNAK